MSIEGLLQNWKIARQGLIPELEQIPADKFDFKATPETRSVAEIARHILATQKVLVSGLCSGDFQLTLPGAIAEANSLMSETEGLGKEELISALSAGMEWAEKTIRAFGETALEET